MLDLGTSLLASAERDPNATAVVDGAVRLSYAELWRKAARLMSAFDALGLGRGDHLVTILQNRWQMATLHWACQIAGIIVTPLNWRAKPDEIGFCIDDADARAVVFEGVSAEPVRQVPAAAKLPRIALDTTAPGEMAFAEMVEGSAPDVSPRAGAEDWSLMLYTSGTTARPKGVPRRHRTERASAVAHVAQNLYARGERTLGVMPLYHTMGVRSLLAMSLIGGTFVCLPRFDAAVALRLIARERISNLYLVPTLYHDLLSDPSFAATDVRSVRKLGFAGAPMPAGLLQRLAAAFNPDLFVNHYGSSEVYTCTIEPNAVAKPGSAGKAGVNQLIRVVEFNARSVADRAALGEEGEIVALLAGDEAFEGYWRRPEATAKALRDGWYFTGDSGYIDADGDLFVTGRVDDMIISGGENIFPAEVEDCLSLHPAVAEVAVAGLPDERLGRIVAAFVRPAAPVTPAELDRHCRASHLADFKRPRRFVFVTEIPRSPVGKLLRRKLVAGEYVPMPDMESIA
jgi:2-furoate---CoA ligase